MNLVFCMAGLYKRFRDAGYATPKFMLPLHGKSTIEHVVGEMVLSAGGRDVFDDVVFIANERDKEWGGRVAEVLASMQLGGERVHFVRDTRGQAHTALLGVDLLESRGGDAALQRPVIFHNIDTILEGRDYRRVRDLLTRADGYIDCIDADKNIYSFVAGETSTEHGPGLGRARRIAEKIVISRHATTGLYGFRSGTAYREWCTRTEPGRRGSTGEFYISAVYQTMLDAGATVLFNTTHENHRTTIVGTPEEYEALSGVTQRPARTGARS